MKAPGIAFHKAHTMQQVGVRKQYAYDESAVVPNPEDLEDNAGEVCTSENVADCIRDLMELGYGGGKAPYELASEQASIHYHS